MAQHIIAKNTNEGKSTFHDIPKYTTIPSPWGSIEFVYAQATVPADVSASATDDLALTAQTAQGGSGLANRRIVPDGGLASAVITIDAGATVPPHRTRSLDTGVVVQGEVEVLLDEGARTLRPGDTWVLRGARHGWANRTAGPAKIFGVGVDVKTILDGSGAELPETSLRG